jgi:hypothetical protein
MDEGSGPDGDITDVLSGALQMFSILRYNTDSTHFCTGLPDQTALRRPSLGNLTSHPKQQMRSQTAPGSIPVHSTARPPFRRNQTTSTKLDIDGLIQTCAVVTGNASQAPVSELVHATTLINKVGTKLTEHLARRLAEHEAKPDS